MQYREIPFPFSKFDSQSLILEVYNIFQKQRAQIEFILTNCFFDCFDSYF